jgi:hypothetical protein
VLRRTRKTQTTRFTVPLYGEGVVEKVWVPVPPPSTTDIAAFRRVSQIGEGEQRPEGPCMGLRGNQQNPPRGLGRFPHATGRTSGGQQRAPGARLLASTRGRGEVASEESAAADGV